MEEPPEPTCKTSEFANFIGRSVRLVQLMIQKGVLPLAEKGRLDTWDALNAYITHMQQTLGDYDVTPADIIDARKRYALAKAEKKEIEVALLKSELVYVDDVMSDWMNATSNFRGKILAMPSKLAAQCSGADSATIKSVWDKMVEEALAELEIKKYAKKSQ